eukprot:gene6325-biopygen6293
MKQPKVTCCAMNTCHGVVRVRTAQSVLIATDLLALLLRLCWFSIDAAALPRRTKSLVTLLCSAWVVSDVIVRGLAPADQAPDAWNQRT